MTPKERKLDDWALSAYKAIDKDWERCDAETGRECRGVRCAVGSHRAMIFLHRIMDEIAQ